MQPFLAASDEEFLAISKGWISSDFSYPCSKSNRTNIVSGFGDPADPLTPLQRTFHI